jgi:hypothetical protein
MERDERRLGQTGEDRSAAFTTSIHWRCEAPNHEGQWNDPGTLQGRNTRCTTLKLKEVG